MSDFMNEGMNKKAMVGTHGASVAAMKSGDFVVNLRVRALVGLLSTTVLIAFGSGRLMSNQVLKTYEAWNDRKWARPGLGSIIVRRSKLARLHRVTRPEPRPDPSFRSISRWVVSNQGDLKMDLSTYENNNSRSKLASNRDEGAVGVQRASFFETFVHPALICHGNPATVAVLGENEDRIVSEAFKHSTVTRVDVLSQLLEPLRSQTSNPFSKSLDRSNTSKEKDRYDVILWNERVLVASHVRVAADLLSDEGILVLSYGKPKKGTDSNAQRRRRALITALEDADFEAIILTSDDVLLAMKNKSTKANWYRNEAETQLLIRKHTLFTQGVEQPPISVFDGATMMSIRFPSRLAEEEWCQQQSPGMCYTGHGFDPEVPNVPVSALEVRISGYGEKSGRGVYTRKKIIRGTLVGLEECVLGMLVPPSSYDLIINEMSGEKDLEVRWRSLQGYIHGYGWTDNIMGRPGAGVDPGIMTFMNHGCNGTYNYGMQLNVTEQTAVLGVGPEANGYIADEEQPFNPYVERSFPSWFCDDTGLALRDLEAGEELLDNYLVFGGSVSGDTWEENLIELKGMCSGAGIGSVKAYEENDFSNV